MKRLRNITLIFCILWVVGVICVTGFRLYSVRGNSSYDATSDNIKFMGSTYVSNNANGFGKIYQLDNNGKTEKIYVTKRRKNINGWKVVALASADVDGKVGGDFYAILEGKKSADGYIPYRLLAYTDNLGTDRMTPSFYLRSNFAVTGFALRDEVLYITGITENRQEIYIYSYEVASMVPMKGASASLQETLVAPPATLTEIDSRKSDDGSSYADAEYDGISLYVRFSGQPADAYFAVDTGVKNLFESRKETIMQRMLEAGISVIYTLANLVIGCIIINLIVKFLSRRKNMFYRILLAELVIVAGCLLFLNLSSSISYRVVEQEFLRGETFSLTLLGNRAPTTIGTTEFYDTADYNNYLLDMKDAMNSTDTLGDVKDIAVVSNDSQEVIMSVKGYSGDDIKNIYGNAAADLVSETESVGHVAANIWGDNVQVITVQMANAPRYQILAVASMVSSWDYMMSNAPVIPLATMLLILILSVATDALIIRQSNEMHEIGRALEKLGSGEEDIEIAEGALGYDIRRMWSSINEIAKNVKRINHDKYMTYEAYYRFAPKRIEKILKKNAITDVEIGDTRNFTGTVAMVMTGEDRRLDVATLNQRNAFFSLMEKHVVSAGGTFVSMDSTLSLVRVLFEDRNKGSIRFGAQLSREVAETGDGKKATILLHYDSLLYGVAGTEELAYTVLYARDLKKLGEVARWLGTIGVSMVITEPVKNREGGNWDLRYIGFIIPDEGDRSRRINLYEVLDAADGESRRGKKRTMAVFDEALKLFYENDFYFARNAFTDILREVPQDEVAKWYLFECEKHLNETILSEFAGELHVD